MKRASSRLWHLLGTLLLIGSVLLVPNTIGSSPTPAHADLLAPVSAHDPSRMVFDPVGNRWLIFYTGNGIPFALSTDQTTWTHASTNRVFPSSGAGADNTNYWAPDMWPTPIHGQYLLFYSLSSFGSQNSTIQVASTPALTNPTWTKLGAAVTSVTTCSGLQPDCNAPNPDFNAIDPTPFYDPVQDRLWITFGSFWDGIYIVELNPSNPTQELSAPVHLAGGRPALAYSPTTYPDSIEGSFLWFHDGYYYLTASTDTCCAGSASTYKLIIGRSTQITGPYVDKDGVDLTNYGGSIFAASAGPEIGVGQMGLYSLNGVDHYTYHIESYAGVRGSPLGSRAIDYDPATGWPLAVYPQTVPTGIYTIQRGSTGLYLHVRDESTEPAVEGHVEQDVLGTRLSQNWVFFAHSSPGGDTYYNIQNAGTGLWLEVCCDAGPGDNRGVPQAGTGTDFIRVDYAHNLGTNDDQKWRVVQNTDGTYGLQSYRSGLMLGFPTSDTTPLLPALQEPWIRAQQPYASFQLTAAPTTGPTLSLPDDMVLSATSPAGAVATFSASASEQVGGLTYTLPVTFSMDSGSVFPIGKTTVTATATDLLGNPVAGSFTVTVVQATPVISWAAPADITYGTALGSIQLSATAADPTTNAPVSGTFIYTPPAGTVLPAGNGQALNVSFTPDDSITYTPATGATTINVNPAPLTITANDQTMTYGGPVPAFTARYDGFVNGDGSSVVSGLTCGATDGTGHAVSSTTPAGTYTIACSGATAANYSIGYVAGTLTIRLFASGNLLALSQDGASCHLLLNGGAAVTAAGNIAVNGSSTSALCLNSATVGGTTISVQGGMQNNNSTVHGMLLTHQPATADLLATLPAPSAPVAACPGAACPDGTNLNSGHTYRLLPGTYTQAINMNSGATVCVAPGVYVLKASWTLNSVMLHPYGSAGCPALPGGTTDPGVLLYFAQGHVVLNSSGDLSQLRAPQSGPYAGLLYWQADGESTSLNGSGGFAGGAWYEPHGALVLNGSTHLTAPYVTAATITVNGRTSLSVTGS